MSASPYSSRGCRSSNGGRDERARRSGPRGSPRAWLACRRRRRGRRSRGGRRGRRHRLEQQVEALLEASLPTFNTSGMSAPIPSRRRSSRCALTAGRESRSVARRPAPDRPRPRSAGRSSSRDSARTNAAPRATGPPSNPSKRRFAGARCGTAARSCRAARRRRGSARSAPTARGHRRDHVAVAEDVNDVRPRERVERERKPGVTPIQR